jgi:hypothetical protein
MQSTEQRYIVDGFTVTLIRDQGRVRWECGCTRPDCTHMLQAAVWLTLESWQNVKLLH